MSGTLHVVGIGPGDAAQMTPVAASIIRAADVITGYSTYIDLIPQLLTGKEVFATGMGQEVARCQEALRRAASGEKVVMICSGDAGIYGMAGLVLELAEGVDVEVTIIPGISAVQAAAALLGAPLMHDFAVISLSDLLTPWDTICRRLDAAGSADFVVALYNPQSRGRTSQIVEAREILLRHRDRQTPVGIVRNASRSGESVAVTNLESMLEQEIDMFSVVIIGNSSTFVDTRGKMVTPRGYNLPDCQTRAEKSAMPLHARTFHPSPRAAVKAKALFVGGTGSDVGKSIIVAGLCRALYRRGFAVAPFKAQNMALNSAVTPEGGEIGRAQALQAAACCLAPHTDMNPVLLKPNSETGSQVIINGRPVGNMSVKEYHGYKAEAFQQVEEAYERLATGYDLIIMEGAGSIAEINLMAHDITNLKAAAMAHAPVVLVADIDRGGVFASIVGTLELLDAEERGMLAGVVINKFRGDAALLRPGLEFLEARTGVPLLGVIPWLKLDLPEEDSVALGRKRKACHGDALRIGVMRLPRLSNYTDFDPLEREPGVDLVYLDAADDFAGLDLLILPGTKNTLDDLDDLCRQGLDAAIIDFHRAGGCVVGICGGYQMLGRRISDPHGVESSQDAAAGLGLLDIETTLCTEKQTHQSRGHFKAAACAAGFVDGGVVSGYEIHMGETMLGSQAAPLLQLSRRSGMDVALEDGAISEDGRVWGTYLHDIFSLDEVRQQLLDQLRRKRGLPSMPVRAADILNQELDRLAEHLEAHLDMDALLAMLQLTGVKSL
ncbi:MAG: cobyric acid synthase [Desulfuromonadales bacterium]